MVFYWGVVIGVWEHVADKKWLMPRRPVGLSRLDADGDGVKLNMPTPKLRSEALFFLFSLFVIVSIQLFLKLWPTKLWLFQMTFTLCWSWIWRRGTLRSRSHQSRINWAFCYTMLHKVSRSFTLVIHQLGTELRNAASTSHFSFYLHRSAGYCVYCLWKIYV